MKALNFFFFLFAFAIIVVSCNKDEPTPTGTVMGVVTDGDSAEPLAAVRVVLFDANTNQPASPVITTLADGTFSFSLPGGSYYLRLSRQGYNEVPARGVTGLAFTITNDQTITRDVEMFQHNIADLGSISGRISGDIADPSGALVVIENGTIGYSTVSDVDGTYVIYNVPAGNYSIRPWRAGMDAPEKGTTITANAETSDVNFTVADDVLTQVSGSVTFLATSNKEVDVSLTHPVTGEAIPGLGTTTSSQNYEISNVPYAIYLARASYANDGIVMDPDWIVKNGEPFVTVQGGPAVRDFSVTGSANLVSPTNEASSTIPVAVSATPTFTWEAYPSSTDYVIEVTDANGQLIWGGFNEARTEKNIVILASQTSIVYNSDGLATQELVSGRNYRWRIYASKDANNASGWILISSSEEQRGLIAVE